MHFNFHPALLSSPSSRSPPSLPSSLSPCSRRSSSPLSLRALYFVYLRLATHSTTKPTTIINISVTAIPIAKLVWLISRGPVQSWSRATQNLNSGLQQPVAHSVLYTQLPPTCALAWPRTKH